MFDDFSTTHFTIQNQKIVTLEGEVPLDQILFYPENPRIYSIVCNSGSQPTQEEIFQTLAKMDHVKRLRKSIEDNGGLTDPIIIKRDTFEVLEGNSRLAAYKLLHSKDPIKWGKILTRVLPLDISDSQIFTLLGEYHVHGKKDWSPFEVANYVYRRATIHNITMKQIGLELSISPQKVSHMINVIETMQKVKDTSPSRWSYYDEYLKSRKIKKARAKHSQMDTVVLEQIKKGNITKATDIRDKLTLICTGNDKNIKKFIKGERTLEQSYESAQDQGMDSYILCKLKRTREALADTALDRELKEISKDTLQKCEFELSKINTRLSQLTKNIHKIRCNN